MKIGKYKMVILIITAFILIISVIKPLRLACSSIISSLIMPVDSEFVINEKEWISESGSIIRFDNGESTLSNDTIYYFGEPEFIVTKLNKYFNEMTVIDLKTNNKILYTSTREFTK